MRPSPDTVTALTAYIVLLFAIPTDLRIPALGGAGSVSSLVALGGGVWWCWFHLQRERPRRSLRVHPVRIAALAFLGCVTASYIVAMTRPIAVGEVSQADQGILRLLAGISILLLAADALTGVDRLHQLLERFAWAGGGLALLGLAQFLTGRSFVDAVSIPGMVSSQGFSAVVDRGGFTRSAATAMSPLEYGAALSATFPLALTFALYGHRGRVLRWVPAVATAAALMVSGSRSSLLGLAVAVLVLCPAWTRRVRVRMGLAGIGAVFALALLVPGMIGTLRYLFLNTAVDSSAQSRSGSYDIVGEFVARSPVLGRGFGTFLPEYRILDNQFALLLVEVGVLGTLTFVTVSLSAAASALTARRQHRDELTRQLGQALAASVLTVTVLAAFFDALSFPLAAGCFFLTAGLCGGYHRAAGTAEA